MTKRLLSAAVAAAAASFWMVATKSGYAAFSASTNRNADADASGVNGVAGAAGGGESEKNPFDAAIDALKFE